MTYTEAKKRYAELYKSSDPKNRMQATGLLEIIRSFERDNLGEISSAVAISRIAEKYAKEQDDFFKTFGKEEYKQKSHIARECIIRYMTTDEITKSLISYKSEPTLANYVAYMKGAGLIDRIKTEDLKSALELAKLQ